MSYLTQYTLRRPSPLRVRRGVRVDECTPLNLPEFDGGAHVRVFVEDTSQRKIRLRRSPPSPKLRLRIGDCANVIHLEFGVECADRRENSLHKIDTLLSALHRFRDGLAAEAQLYEQRERRN